MVHSKDGVLQSRNFRRFEFTVRSSECPKGSLTFGAVVKTADRNAKAQPVVRRLFQNLSAVGDVDLAPADCTGMRVDPTDHRVMQHKSVAGIMIDPILRQGVHFFHGKGKSDPKRQVVSRRRKGRYVIKFKPLGHEVHSPCPRATRTVYLDTHFTP